MTAPRITGGPLPPQRALRYLALGDSYTIGEGVAPADRWPVQLAHALRAGGVMLGDPKIIATTGWTTDELSAAMDVFDRSAEHTSAHQSLMRNSYAVFCLKKKKKTTRNNEIQF